MALFHTNRNSFVLISDKSSTIIHNITIVIIVVLANIRRQDQFSGPQEMDKFTFLHPTWVLNTLFVSKAAYSEMLLSIGIYVKFWLRYTNTTFLKSGIFLVFRVKNWTALSRINDFVSFFSS